MEQIRNWFHVAFFDTEIDGTDPKLVSCGLFSNENFALLPYSYTVCLG